MNLENLVLQGKHVRLEPLAESHIDGLAAAAETTALSTNGALSRTDNWKPRSTLKLPLHGEMQGRQ